MLAQLLNTGTASDMIFTLPAAATDAYLEDDGVNGNSLLRLRSNNGTFDTTAFANPTGSLTINRGNAAATLTITAIPDFTAALTIGSAAEPFNQIGLAGAITLAANKSLNGNAADAIVLGNTNSDIATSGTGAIRLTTTKSIYARPGSSLTAVNGDIVLSANDSGTTGGDFVGIMLETGAISTWGSGNITLVGKGGSGTSTSVSSYGIEMTGAAISTGGGTISLTGIGGGGPADNHGIELHGSANSITASGDGGISLDGRGIGPGTCAGVDVRDSGANLATTSGDISISGAGSPTGAGNSRGVDLSNFVVQSDGAGNITIQGTGSSTAGATHKGAVIDAGVQVFAKGSGSISITGNSGIDTSLTDLFIAAGALIDSSTANTPITLTANSMSIATSASPYIINAGTGTVTLKPRTAGTYVAFGDGDAAGILGLTDAELDRIKAGTLLIGDSNTNGMAIDQAITRPTITNLELRSGSFIALNPGSIDTAGGTLRFVPGGGRDVQPASSGVDVTASTTSFAAGAKLGIYIGGAAVDTGYTRLNVVGQIDLSGAVLSLQATYTPAANESFVIVNNDGADPVIGTFNGLPEGSLVSVNGENKKITYVGGTGNDVVLLATPATRTWDGGGGDNNWTTAANWTNDVAPIAGDSLVFPAGAARLTNTNNFPAETVFGSLSFSGDNYNISGNQVALTGGMYATQTTGIVILTFAVKLASSQTFGSGPTLGNGLQLLGALELNGNNLNVDAQGGAYRFSGVISGNGDISKTGSGQMYLANSSDNTYVGTTFVNEGYLYIQLGNDGITAIPGNLVIGDGVGSDHVVVRSSNRIADSANVTINSSGIFELNTANGNQQIGVNETVGLVTMAGGLIETFGQALGTLTVLGNITANAASTSASIQGSLSLGGSTKTITVADGSAQNDFVISAVVSSGALTKAGAGTRVLSGNNTYAGPTILSGGLLSVTSLAVGGAASGIGASSSLASNLVLNGGTLRYTGPSVTTDRLFSVGVSGATIESAGTGSLTFNNTGALDVSNGSGSRTLTLTGSSLGTLFPTIGDNGGPSSLVVTGTSQWELRGNNTYSGTTTIDGSVLLVGGGTSVGSLGIGPIHDNGFLYFTRTGTVILNSAIDGTGSLFQAASGTLVLTAENYLSGLTTVSVGALRIDGSLPAAINVNNGILGGGGNTGAVMMNSGGILAPGASPGVLSTGNIALAGGSTFAVELNGATAGSGYDQLNVTGSVSLGGATLAVTRGYLPTNGTPFVLINNDGADQVAGTFAGLNEGAALVVGGKTFTISYSGGDGNDVVLTAVPATRMWDGGGTDSNWSTAANWAGDVAPFNGDSLVFSSATPGVTRFTNNNDFPALSVGSITIASSTSAFDLNGNAITLSGGIASSGTASSSRVALAGITLAAPQTFSASGSAFTVQTPIANAGFDLTITGTATKSFNGPISGVGGLSFINSSDSRLGGSQTYSGLTQINNSFVQLVQFGGIAGSLGDVTSGTEVTNGTLNYAFPLTSNESITLSGDISTLRGQIGAVQAGPLTLATTTQSTVVTFGGNFTISGPISGSGGSQGLSLAPIGSGQTIILSGINTYTGFTALTGGAGGVVKLGASEVIPDSSSVSINPDIIWDLNGNSETINGLSGSGLISNTAAGLSTLSIGASSSGGTFDGTISGPLALTKLGSGTLTLSGANTYSAMTAVNAGVLVITHNSALGTTAGGTTVAQGATLRLAGGTSNLTVAEPLSLSGSGISGTGALRSVSGFNTWSGSVTLAADSAVVLADKSLSLSGPVDTNAYTLTFDQSSISTHSADILGVISGSGGLTKTGPWQLNLYGANTYSGLTTINTGILAAQHSSALGGTTAGTVVNSGGMLLVGQSITLQEPLTISGSGPTAFGAGALAGDNGTVIAGPVSLTGDATIAVYNSGSTLTISGTISDGEAGHGVTLNAFQESGRTLVLSAANQYAGSTTVSSGKLRVAKPFGAIPDNSAVTVSSGALLDIGGNFERIGSLQGAGNVELGSGSALLTTGLNSASTVFSGIISGSGEVVKAGIGTFTLSGANTYSGTLSIADGTLQLGASNVLSDSMRVAPGAGALLDLAGHSETIGALDAGRGTVTNSSVTAATLTLGGENTSGTFAGKIQNGAGPIDLVKTGSGIQTLSGANTYTGPTVIRGGELVVNGSLAGGLNIEAGSGGILSGSGTIGGPTIINASGQIKPGGSLAGRLTAGAGAANLELRGGSALGIQINGSGPATGYDQLKVNGSLLLTTQSSQQPVLTIAGSHAPMVGEQFVILDNDGTDSVSGNFSGLAEGARLTNFLASGLNARISYAGGDGNDVVLTVMPPNQPPIISFTGATDRLDGDDNRLNWAITDDYGISSRTVVLRRVGDNSIQFSNATVDSGYFDLKGLGVGAYQVEATATDSDGLVTSAIASFQISDDDPSPPVITLSGSIGNETDDLNQFFTWNIADASGISARHVSFTRDGSELFFYQTDSATVDFNVFEPGTYGISVTATDADNDGPGDSLTSTATRTVTIADDDTSGPTITLSGSTGNETDDQNQFFAWNIADASGIPARHVSFTIDGSEQFFLESDSGTIDFNVFGPGTYGITVTATDGDNDHPGDSQTSIASRTVVVSDDDIAGPTITLGGSTGNETDNQPQQFTWNATDPSGVATQQVTVTQNGVTVYTNSAVGSGSFNFDGYGLGTFQITVAATDADNDYHSTGPIETNPDRAAGSATRTVVVTDDDSAAPLITLSGSSGNETDGQTQLFDWSISDASGIAARQVTIMRNGGAIFANQIDNGSFIFDNYGPGTYVITVTATDADNDRPSDSQSASASRTVVVSDDDSSPPSIVLSGSTGLETDNQLQQFTWNISDASGIATRQVTITQNGATIFTSAAAINGGSFNFDSFGLGTFQIAVTASDADNDYDGFGQIGPNPDRSAASASRTVTVSDDDTFAPLITFGGSSGSETADKTQYFSWSASDASNISASQVTITRNGASIYTSQLPGGNFNFDSFGIGTYVISVTATDGDNDRNGDWLTSTSTRSVVVSPSPPPTITGTSPQLNSSPVPVGTRFVTVAFSTTVSGANTLSSYELWNAGGNGVLGDSDDNRVPLFSATGSGSFATIQLVNGLVDGAYRLRVYDVIKNSTGAHLDGDGDGVAGGNWVRDFIVGTGGSYVNGGGTAVNGYLVGATAFFDADFNGSIDAGEPSSITDGSGGFSIPVPSVFDTNANGALDDQEGQWVVMGGTDSSTGLPAVDKLIAPASWKVVTPLTTLAASLVANFGLSAGDAADCVKDALELPDVDLATLDPIAATLAGDHDAPAIFAAHARVQDTIAQTMAILSADSGAPPADDLTSAIVAQLAAQIVAPDATLDLDNPAAVQNVLLSASAASGLTISNDVAAGAATVIAAANQLISAIPATNGVEYLERVAQIKSVSQSTVAEQLAQAATGQIDITTVIHASTGDGLAAEVAAESSPPPTLILPDSFALDATTAAGAVVTFSASATNFAGQSVPVICSPASGSFFPVGVTVVNCTATDAVGGTVTRTFTVTVHGMAFADSVVTPEDESASGNVLSNDSPGLTIVSVAGLATGALGQSVATQHGSVVLSADGAFKYTPNNAGEATADSFAYVVSDGHGGTSTATVTVTVNRYAGVSRDASGILRFGGSAGSDVVTVGGGNLMVNGVATSLAGVREVRIWSRGGNDQIDLSGLTIPAFVNGGDGNDTLTGGSADDVIFGGLGDDAITGAAGNDFLVGGGGKDRIVGSAGNDILVSGDIDASLDIPALSAISQAWSGSHSATDNSVDDLIDKTAGDIDADQLTGASGADLFIINSGDTITDFQFGKPKTNKDGDVVIKDGLIVD